MHILSVVLIPMINTTGDEQCSYDTAYRIHTRWWRALVVGTKFAGILTLVSEVFMRDWFTCMAVTTGGLIGRASDYSFSENCGVAV